MNLILPSNLIGRVGPLALVALCTAGLAGCATVEPPKPLVTGSTALIGSVRVSPHGMNWRIESTAEESARRFTVHTYASDCSDRSGKLFVDGPTGRYEPTLDVVSVGSRPEDKLFLRLCAEGLPQARAQAARRPAPTTEKDREMSPAERAILLQHMLNNALPQTSPSSETRCERVRGSTTGEVVCKTR